MPSGENPELWTLLTFRPLVGQNIASNASPAARKSAFLVHSTSFYSNPLERKVMCDMRAISSLVKVIAEPLFVCRNTYRPSDISKVKKE